MPPRVIFLVPSEAAAELVEGIAQVLLKKFGIGDVTCRSSGAPLERMLMNVAPGTALLVLLCAPGDAIAAVVEKECKTVPLIVLDSTTSKAASFAADSARTIAKFCSLSGSADLIAALEQVAVEQEQADLVLNAQLQTKSPLYSRNIALAYDNGTQITGDKLGLPDRKRGKVRDRYEIESKPSIIALVTTDRQSGFDRQLALVPFKGAVLNLTSAFWFEQTKSIIPNHLISVPHPYVSIVKKCKPFPIEFVVRSYMTGSTSTSIWKNYQDGVRVYCGHPLPEGMKKNEKLAANLLTPTTKEEEHDRPISAEDIIKEEWMTADDWEVCSMAALKVFALGQKIASEHGLILVDTKYEFGKDLETGEILLIDEVHTPDSSRYWLASSYEERIAAGLEPENIDKEFLRLWFRKHCDPYKDAELPDAPRDLVLELARRYITLYEMITWKIFDFGQLVAQAEGETAEGAIAAAIKAA